MKGCIIFVDDGLVLFGDVWCFGVNQVIKILFSDDVILGGKVVKGGEYVVFVKLIVKSWEIMFFLYEGGNWGSY